MRKLTEQTVLAEVAKNDRSGEVQQAAVAKLTVQALLADVAKGAANSDIRRAAMKELTDLALLADVAACLKLGDSPSRVQELTALLTHANWQSRLDAAGELIEIAYCRLAVLAKQRQPVGSLVSQKHEDRHADGTSNDRTHNDQHTDAGTGLTFPPFPVNITK